MSPPLARDPRPYTLAGYDVALAARRPKDRVLVVYLDRAGQPTDRYREVDLVALRRIGTHFADLKAARDALPEARFKWEPTAEADRSLPGARRLFAHHAIPAGDE